MASVLPTPSSALASVERIGFETARVLDQRSGRVEPVGQEVELHIRGTTLQFCWGEAHELGTAAYWSEQTRRRGAPMTYALGTTLSEEVAACVLGGHGIPATVGLAAYGAVRKAGLLDETPSATELEEVLSRPLVVAGRAHPVRYRFARQRASRLSAALRVLASTQPPTEPLELRSWLTTLPGVGPKTASWVVRNRHACDDVAIVDIHLQRAGVAAGFFSPAWRLPRDYTRFENAFCQVAQMASVAASALDACIWDQMQYLGRAQHLLLGSRTAT